MTSNLYKAVAFLQSVNTALYKIVTEILAQVQGVKILSNAKDTTSGMY